MHYLSHTMAEEALNKPRSIELINDKEREIKFYQTYLDNLAQGSTISSEIFRNKGEAHASILMATLLANTEKTLKLYCRGLTPGILCGKEEKDGIGFEGAYWEEFKRFFDNTIKSSKFNNNSIQILIQDDSYLNNQPFIKVKAALRNPETKNKIQVRKITPNSKAEIDKFLGNSKGENYNFAVFDGKAFRLEYNPDTYQAIGSFHSLSWCNLLGALFDKAFNQAELIPELNTK